LTEVKSGLRVVTDRLEARELGSLEKLMDPEGWAPREIEQEKIRLDKAIRATSPEGIREKFQEEVREERIP
jgi:hypothetical protein